MEAVRQRFSDRKVMKLIRSWLKAGMMGDGLESKPTYASPTFAKVEHFVIHRINLFLRRRSQRARRVMQFPEARRLGLPRLQGTIRNPVEAHARTG